MIYDPAPTYYLRPTLVQERSYTSEPQYYKHKATEDKLAILVCQIKIWEPNGTKWFDIPHADSANCLTIRECESIEINSSAKELIGKAVLRLPRGTVVNKTCKKEEKVNVGEKDTQTDKQETISKATHDGEVIIPKSSLYAANSIPTTSLAWGYDDKGFIDFQRPAKEPALLSPHDIAIGNRIEIRLGYAYSEREFKELNSQDNGAGSVLDVAFTGIITSISVDTPLEIECTNMAHILTTVSTPNINADISLKVKDFLDDSGEFHLLKDTGIPLAKYCEGCEITVTGGTISDNLTVADVLEAWNKSGILCIMDTKSDGTVELRVGLAFYAGSGGLDLPNTDKKYITYNGGNNIVKLIQFDWDVAQDKLGLKQVDKKYLAVEAHGQYIDKESSKDVQKYFKLTLRKKPDKDDEGWMDTDDGQFQIVNHREDKGRKQIKHKNGTESDKRINGHLEDKVNLKKYNVVPYFSLTKNVSEKELIEEAKQYWAKYNPNGITGSISIFGDLFIKPTDVVGLIDMRQPEKNGYYYVESVNTTFGVDGFRRELTFPYKIANFSKQPEII